MTSNLTAAIFIFFRLSAITLAVPVFPFAFLPVIVRFAVTAMFAIAISVCLDASLLDRIPTKISFILLASEFVLGVILSLGFHAASAAVQMMAQLVDIQTGLAVASTFDPTNYQSNSTLGTLLSLIVIICFFGMGVHCEIITAFTELFSVSPPGTSFIINANYLHSISKMFLAGFVLASPIILGLWLLDIAISIASRSLPQVQLYFVMMPFKICASFLLIGLVLSNADNGIHLLLKSSLYAWTQLTKV